MSMAKGWTTIYTNTDKTTENTRVQINRSHKFDNTIKATKTPTLDQLKREFDIAYEVKCLEDARLMDGFDQKKLKSKTLIKRALRMKKEQEKAAAKEAAEKKVEVTTVPPVE